jgi:hypothetical protein
MAEPGVSSIMPYESNKAQKDNLSKIVGLVEAESRTMADSDWG